MPLAVVGGIVVVLGGIPAFFLTSGDDRVFGLHVPLRYAIPYLIVVYAYVAALLSIVAFNRPKTAVPPHLWDGPGAFGEWLGGRPRRRPDQRRASQDG